MKRILPAFLLLAVSGCYWELADEKYFNQPPDKDGRYASGHKTVWNDKDAKVGYVEIQTSWVAGSKESHEDYFVKDTNNNLLGFITEKGSTYRFKRGSSETVHVGNYTLDDGIRTLLGVSSRIDLRSTKIED